MGPNLLFDRCSEMPLSKRPHSFNKWIDSETNQNMFDSAYAHIHPKNVTVEIGYEIFVAHFNDALELRNYKLAKHIFTRMDHKVIDYQFAPKFQTPLNLAISIRHADWKTTGKRSVESFELIQAIVRRGADVNIAYNGKYPDEKSFFFESPLTLSLKTNDYEVAKLLIYYGAEKQKIMKDLDNDLEEQKFSVHDETIYLLILKTISVSRILVWCGSQLAESPFRLLPFDVIKKILTCDYVESQNRQRILEAEEQIKLNRNTLYKSTV